MVCTGCKQWCWLHKPIRLWDNSRLLLFICCPLHFNTLKLNLTNIATKNNFHWLLGGVVAKNACFIYLWIDYHREYQGKLPLFSPHSFTTQQNVLLREICFFYLCLLPLNPSHMCLLISIAQLKESTLSFILAHSLVIWMSCWENLVTDHIRTLESSHTYLLISVAQLKESTLIFSSPSLVIWMNCWDNLVTDYGCTLESSHTYLLISIAQLKESTLIFSSPSLVITEWIVGRIWSLIMVVLSNPATHTCWLA